MTDQHTMWSQTLLEDFIQGMKGNPSDEWILSQLRELRGRGMSPDYLAKLLRKDVSERAAERLQAAVKRGGTVRAASEKKGGLLSRLFSK